MNKKGQSVFSEYVMIFFVVIAAAVAMTTFVQRSFEARLHDVPLLLRATNLTMIHDQQDGDALILKYASCFSLADAVIFYEEHMERFGWHKLACFESGQEVLLNYQKPQKYCSISLRVYPNELGVVLYAAPKTMAEA